MIRKFVWKFWMIENLNIEKFEYLTILYMVATVENTQQIFGSCT